MVNYFIYAKDFSVSTKGVEYYHSNGLRTIEQFKCDVEKIQKEQLIDGEPPTESKIVYLHWGYDCREVDEDETRKAYLEREGLERDTQPERIIQCLKENYILNKNDRIKLLYIITDGLINSERAKKCFELNENMHYETVVFHALNQDPDEVNLSVAASFFKSRCIVYCNDKLYDSTDISKEYDYDKINVYNFEAEKDQLKSYIKLKFIHKFQRNADALQEIDKLKKLRNRLFADLSLKTGNSEKVLETKDRNLFLHEFVKTIWYKNLTTSVNTDKVEIEKSISTLISYIVSDAKSYSFDALRFHMEFNKSVGEEQIVDVNFTSEQEIEFPDVILNDDKGIPVVTLQKFNLMDKILFRRIRWLKEGTSASFSKFKSIIECPLFLLTHEEVTDSIGYFYTLNVYKQLLANDIKTDPCTGMPFHGGLVLTDTDHFDKYNDCILAGTFFNFKKINFNIGLFYFVLWKKCEYLRWTDSNVNEQFKKYAMRRISETVCKIGLSSLPLDPQVNTSLLTALWYCVELSSGIFKNDPQNFKHERLRRFYSVAPYMIEILNYFNYDLDQQSIEKRRELINYAMLLKKIHGRREKVYSLLKRIFKTKASLYLVSEIEKPFNLYILNYLKLNHKEMLRDDVVNEKVHLNDYVHLMYMVGNLDGPKAGESTFEICEKTFRPYFTIDRNKSFYMELVKNAREVVIDNDDDKDKIEVTYEAINSLELDRILALSKLFIDYVKESWKYPTKYEYYMYVWKRKKFYGDLVTIFPPNVDFEITDVFLRYENIVTKVDVREFLEVCKTSVSRIERIKAEERVKFRNDDEIREFISSEELKVNLKKKSYKCTSRNKVCHFL